VTAPLLNLGVDIQLPQSTATAVQTDKEPILISVDEDGKLFLTLGGAPRESTDADTLVRKVTAFVHQNPQVPVYIAGDNRVRYGAVYAILPALQQAGISKVGLMSQPVQDQKR
jgi:biopolymer transport protein TolR